MPDFPEAFGTLLTPEECAEIDATLLPTRDRFSIRISVYSWRYLQQVSQGLGAEIAMLTPEQITTWVRADLTKQAKSEPDKAFMGWFGNLLTSSLVPLKKIAEHHQLAIEQLTLEQIIGWFKEQRHLSSP